MVARSKKNVKTTAVASTRNSSKRFLSLPGSWRWPGFDAVWQNMWSPTKGAPMFPPKVWGYGWAFNFAYPLVKTNPLWKRVTAFIIGLITIILIFWMLTSLGFIIYYVIEARFFPAENVVYLTLE